MLYPLASTELICHCFNFFYMMLFIGSLQRGGGYAHLRRSSPHLWSVVFPQPRGDGRVSRWQPVCQRRAHARSAGRTVHGRRVPHWILRAVGGTRHISAAGDLAWHQLWVSDGVVPQSYSWYCQSRPIPVHQGHCYRHRCRHYVHSAGLPVYSP